MWLERSLIQNNGNFNHLVLVDDNCAPPYFKSWIPGPRSAHYFGDLGSLNRIPTILNYWAQNTTRSITQRGAKLIFVCMCRLKITILTTSCINFKIQHMPVHANCDECPDSCVVPKCGFGLEQCLWH